MSLMDWAQRVAKAAPNLDVIEYGPWLGSMRSVSSELVPKEFLASPSQTPALDFLYLPKYGSWKRRGGQSVKFDTFGALVGLLPATWNDEPAASSGGARARQVEEFISDSVTDNIPTVCALATREVTPSTALDIGKFANFWWRDQVNSLNRTLCDDFDTTDTYPAPGSTQYYRVIPLWYDSGDGGITRGINEYLRRFLVSGSRRFQKVGRQWYFPSFYGTPARWNGARGSSGTTITATSDITTYGTQMLVSPVATAISCTTNGTTAVTSAGLFGPVTVGMNISGSGIPSHTFVTVKTDASNITISNAATNSTTANRDFQSAVWQAVQTAGDSIVVQAQATADSRTYYLGLSGTISNNSTYTVRYRARYNGAAPDSSGTYLLALISSDKTRTGTGNIQSNTLTSSFADYSVTINTGSSSPNGALTANSIELGESNSDNEGYYVEFDYITVTVGPSTTAMANRLFPSGPFPPLHCGSVTAGNLAVGANTAYLQPDQDLDDATWTETGTGTNHYEAVDDTIGTPDDTDYVTGVAASGVLRLRLSNPGFSPTSDLYNVTLWTRARRTGSPATAGLSVDIWETALSLERTVSNVSFATSFTTSFANYSYQLTDAEVDSITDWTDLEIRCDVSGAFGTFDISQIWVEITPIGESAGGWKGKDRFYRGFYGVFEDGSRWALTTPRSPNTLLTSGLDLVTVDSANPEATYDKITHNNIPVLPAGFIRVGMCRSPKIDSTTEDNLLLNPYDMRVIWEVDNGTTSYDDFFGDDDALRMDVDATRIRFDHDMPNPARYNAAGAMRMAHAYEKGQNPCAIVIGPVGRSADYDLNLPDTDSTLYSTHAMYMRLDLDTSGVMTLTLARDNAGTVTSDTYASNTSVNGVLVYATIQGLVDAINATSVSGTPDSGQWRAQIIPNASPDALMTDLTPHLRQIASCVVSGQTITKATGGLAKVAVGDYIGGTGVTAGAFVTRVDSDTQLTFSGTIAAATVTLGFWKNLGDSVTGFVTITNSAHNGWQRVIAQSLPGFMYFNKTYLDSFPVQKSSVSMTVASPGASLSAPNCFNTDSIQRLGNRYQAPLEAGIAQGVVAVDDGFVVPFANKVGALKPRSPDRIRDEDYSLIIINEDRGCCAWNTVTTGNKFATLLAPDGLYAADLDRVLKLSGAIWTPPVNDNTTTNVVGIGDFSYEMPRSIAATAQDNDSSYASAKVVGGVIWVAYRTSTSSTHANRLVAYDFSAASDSAGLRALLRDDGRTRWGWSLPLSRTVSVIGTGRRDDGSHLYGWNDENAGSTGDGRIDELETGQTDNGTAISTGTASIPWIQADEGENIAVQHVILEHNSPTGSVGTLVWHRSYSNDSYSLTAGTSTLDLLSELKMLTTPARAVTAAGYFEYKQASGDAREWRKIKVYMLRVPRLRPAS